MNFSHNLLSGKHLEISSLRPSLVSAHGSCPFDPIVRLLDFKMNLVRARKQVDSLPVSLLPIVGPIARINPSIANNLQLAPCTRTVAVRPQRLIAVSITTIIQWMRRQHDNERHLLAIHKLIEGKK